MDWSEYFFEKRLNKINNRKEFFKVNLNEIQEVSKRYNVEAEFTKLAEAKQYRETLMIEQQKNKKTEKIESVKDIKCEIDEILSI